MASKAIQDLQLAAQADNVRGRVIVAAVDRLLTHAQIVALLAGQPVPDDPTLIPVPHRSQETAGSKRYRNDCGPACVGMLLDWKFPTTVQPTTDALAAQTALATNDIGLTTAALVTLAKAHGLTMKLSNNATPAVIRAEIDAGRPCIPLIHYGPLTGRQNQADIAGHFVVVVGYDDDGYYVNDPDWWDAGNKTAEMGHNWHVPKEQFERAIAIAPVPNQAALYVPQPIPRTTDAIYDISHWNTITNPAAFKDASTAIIHKATQGTAWVDSAYKARRTALADGSVLWGAYHFGANADGAAQADHFINTVKPDGTFLLALDFETNPNKAEGTMTVAQAEAFASRIKARTGVYPVLYTRANLLPNSTPILDLCPRWWASYHEAPPTMPPGWTAWALQQYSNGSSDPRLPGASGAIDRNRFNGTLDQLKAFWKSVSGTLALSDPVWVPRYVASPFPAGINLRSGPSISTPTIGNGYDNGDLVNVELASESGGYVREQRGGWLAVKYLSEKPPTPPVPIPDPNTLTVPTIKFGWHVNYDTDIYKILVPHAERMLGKIAGFVVVGMPDLANKLAELGYRVVYRDYFDAQETFKTNWLDGKTEKEAYDIGYAFYFGAHYKNTQLLRKDLEIYIKLTNEVGDHPMLYAFWLGAMAAAEKDGRKLAIFGDSLGSPEVDQWIARIPALRHAMANGHVVTLNEYGRTINGGDANFPVSDDEGYEYFGGRHEMLYDAVPPDCRPYLIIGETGASNSTIVQPFAIDDAIRYSQKLAARKYGEKILFFALYTLSPWKQNNLIGTLPDVEARLKDMPNPPMSTSPAPTPTPIPPATGYKFPFPATIRGAHGNAGGWAPNGVELERVRMNKIELLFIVTYEENQAAITIQRMREAGVKHFVLRATHRGDWKDFASASLPRLQEYAKALGGSQNLAIQIHNEPNLVPEGLGAGWKNGLEFAEWWLKVASVYRQALPGCKLGFPALSPGDNIPGLRQAETIFAVGAAKAINAADWIGVHYYWTKADGSDINPPVALWRSLYGSKALLGTEVGPVNEVPITAIAARRAYEKFGAAGVPICAWLLNSTTHDFALQSWVRQNIVL